MPRARKGAAKTQARRRLIKAVKGFRGARRKLVRTAKVALLRSRQMAYRDRRVRRRDFRKLWILRINAACRQRGMRYSTFINGLSRAKIEINRKMLAHLAIVDPSAFDALVQLAKGAASAPA